MKSQLIQGILQITENNLYMYLAAWGQFIDPNQLVDMASKKLPAALVTAGDLSLLRLLFKLVGPALRPCQLTRYAHFIQ